MDTGHRLLEATQRLLEEFNIEDDSVLDEAFSSDDEVSEVSPVGAIEHPGFWDSDEESEHLSDRLCDLCKKLDAEQLTSSEGFQHTSPSLSSESCLLCKDIFHSPLIKFEDASSTIRLGVTWIESDIGLREARLQILHGEQAVKTSICVMSHEGDPAAKKHFIPGFRLPTCTGSDTTIDIAKGWIQHCVDHHACSDVLLPEDSVIFGMKRNISPTRLLDVEAFEPGCLDVRLATKLFNPGPYATLSHCWGGIRYSITLNRCWRGRRINKFLTTILSMHSRMQRISYGELPPTYRDAVILCRKLGIRYLWIDALCIVQDSVKDWKREVGIMAHIYSNAFLNISADWSPNPEGGIFYTHRQDQQIDNDHTIRITNVLSNGQESSLYFPKFYSPGHYDLDNTFLSGRAWYFQERFLSRRNLHFTQNQLFWECRESFAGEDLIPRVIGRLSPSYATLLRSHESPSFRLHLWCTWVVARYSGAKLTFQTDRLPGISALARVFADEVKWTYLAGLWLEGLWYTLSWYRSDVRDKGKPKDYIAPSWSWACVNAGVSWLIQLPGKQIKRTVKIESAQTRHEYDPFGHVSGGWIRMSGPFVANRLLGDDSDDYFIDNVFLDFPWQYPDRMSLQVSYILLAERDWGNGEMELYLLLLTPKDMDQVPPVYQRLGMATANTNVTCDKWKCNWEKRTIVVV